MKTKDKKLQGQTEFTAKEKTWMAVKYLSAAGSAGAIEFGSFTLLTELNIFRDAGKPYGWSYFIALALSVIWMFTINRRYTFKSATNVPAAMLKVLGYYAVFTPASIWWGNALTGLRPNARWMEYAVLIGTMAVNGLTEFLFQFFVVFRGTINTNKLAKKAQKE
ncbi:MAG: GtrA family protein [Oscillospiraceae bacterium]|nr:GtrA family protein [Oscillospiraceae bacterium]